MFATTIGKRCLRGHELQSRSVSEFAWNLCRRGMLYPQILMYRQPYVHPTHYTYTYGSISLMNKIPCTHATKPPPLPLPPTHAMLTPWLHAHHVPIFPPTYLPFHICFPFLLLCVCFWGWGGGWGVLDM